MPWNSKLTRPLVFADGRELVTLRDAAALLLEKFSTITYTEPLTVALLMKASDRSTHADIEAATNQLERVLRWRYLLR